MKHRRTMHKQVLDKKWDYVQKVVQCARHSVYWNDTKMSFELSLTRLYMSQIPELLMQSSNWACQKNFSVAFDDI